MDTKKCAVLLRAVENGSLTTAAEELGYTPSGVSRIIASLEKEAGFPLLRRNHIGVNLTREGELLLPVLRELVRAAGQFAETSAQIRGVECGSVTVGAAYGVYYPLLARLAAEFGRLHPGIAVSIAEGLSSDLAAMVEEGRADFCVISRREGSFQWTPLCNDKLVVWVPAGHWSVARGAFPAEAFASEPYIEMYPGRESDNSRYFAARGVTAAARCSTSEVSAAFAMIEAGLGVALMNGILQRPPSPRVVSVPLDPPETVKIGLAWPKEEFLSPAARTFAAFARGEFLKNRRLP
ncbi:MULTISPECIES: LysR family transcriptional regulator [unclassified Pyramidobacter]|uniref:LysR family transcriptional regulator n=1 Tax=unclassified Pyramidobacter TaxID=2632171 RepID=UPI00098FC8D6|nr:MULTISPECIES: LysR family transcriptional regulator [unclassified Pyramidobacter]OON89391.1 hypothetical protein B0D78_04350 [Pyramidobacter sp. C12-8]WOL40423.1 LysR family transcriptional regulator [Pyramidobacter sp. YE332]